MSNTAKSKIKTVSNEIVYCFLKDSMKRKRNKYLTGKKISLTYNHRLT